MQAFSSFSGAKYSPYESLHLSITLIVPLGQINPTSPECTQSLMRHSSVLSGLQKQPFIHIVPRIQISPRGYGLSVLKYSRSGKSLNFTAQVQIGPPIWPQTGSSGLELVVAPAVSDIPYASRTGQQNTTFRNSSTSPLIGADAVIMFLTFPPRIELNLLNTQGSQHPDVYWPLSRRFCSFAAIPLSASHLLHPVKPSNQAWIL